VIEAVQPPLQLVSSDLESGHQHVDRDDAEQYLSTPYSEIETPGGQYATKLIVNYWFHLAVATSRSKASTEDRYQIRYQNAKHGEGLIEDVLKRPLEPVFVVVELKRQETQ